MMKIVCLAACATLASAQLSARQQARLSELLSEKSEIADLLAAQASPERARRAAHTAAQPTVFDLTTKLKGLQARFDSYASSSLDSVVSASIAKNIEENEILAKLVTDSGAFQSSVSADIKTFSETIAGQIETLAGKTQKAIDTVSDEVDAEILAANGGFDVLTTNLTAFQKDVDAKLSELDELEESVGLAVDKKLKPIADNFALIDKLKLTYISNPKIPVFRHNWWHTHHHGISWFDGNNGRSFGGVAPSSWTDGNHCANDMNADLKYMKRLFTTRGVADTYGVNICSEVFIMYSSTTGRVCGSLWRIKNTKSSPIRWNPEYMYTSFGGWGEYASVSLNGANTMRHHCNYNWCRRRIDMDLPSNSKGDRISTIIFISMGSGDNGCSEGNHQRSNGHHFNDNSLELPNGLEYVDDLDTASGSWKN